MVADEEELRQLKIKTGSLTRLTKELVLYEKEQKQEQARVAAMKADKADTHDIKHAVRSLAAAVCRVPRTIEVHRRLWCTLKANSVCLSGKRAGGGEHDDPGHAIARRGSASGSEHTRCAAP